MAKNDNIKDFCTDIADAIRRKEGSSELINPQDFSQRIDNLQVGGGTDGGVKYYKGSLGAWTELLGACPVFMPIKSSGAGWGIFSTGVILYFGSDSVGLLEDGTTIIKVYSGEADTRDYLVFEQFPFRSFEQYVEFVRTQGAEMGINEEYTEITENEFYELFEQIKNNDTTT